jgi:CheY-like chemotaxis protein
MESTENVLDGIRVLCVDGCPNSVKLLHLVLSRRGAKVRGCASVAEAIAVLTDERFDVVISDLKMPAGIDGYDLAHVLRKMEDQDPTRKATPTVAVSSDALNPSRKRRFADFQVYMTKPFDNSRLVNIIERLAEADGEAVKLGSLGSWEAEQATQAALVATEVAATATAAAVDATFAASEATIAAVDATNAAAKGTLVAAVAENSAAEASSRAPL